MEPDWDWCQQCGYDPEGLRSERVKVGVVAAAATSTDKSTRRRRSRDRKQAASVAAAPSAAIDLRPPPPRRPTETVYGALPYDDPSSVSPVVPDPPDNSEIINRRFAIVALCVIVVGLAVLVTVSLVG